MNTLRIVTYLRNQKVKIWGCYLKISIGRDYVDNQGNGGIAVWIQKNGIINTPGVTRKPHKKNEQKFIYHPLTKEKIVGLKIPYWKAIIKLVKNVALVVPSTRTVGWDIAVKTNGPCIIEGNSSWGHYIFQVPRFKGLRHIVSQAANMTLIYD